MTQLGTPYLSTLPGSSRPGGLQGGTARHWLPTAQRPERCPGRGEVAGWGWVGLARAGAEAEGWVGTGKAVVGKVAVGMEELGREGLGRVGVGRGTPSGLDRHRRHRHRRHRLEE